MAGILLVVLLSILIMISGNTRYLAVPAVAIPTATNQMEPERDPVLRQRNFGSELREETRGGAGLRVMTYNIHYGTGVSGKLDLEKIATTIRAVDPDIIALQEVDCNYGKRSEYQDQPVLLADYLGMHYVYGESLKVQHFLPGRGSGYYGNMVLSRYPIVDSELVRLPTVWGAEPRTALKAIIAAPQGQIVVWSTHLGLSQKGRLVQVNTLLASIDAERYPSIVLGDFNALPHSPEIRVMASRLEDVGQLNRNEIGTFYVGHSQPMPRIDYIWLDQSLKAVSYEVIPSEASDHLAVVADVVILSKGSQVEIGNGRGE